MRRSPSLALALCVYSTVLTTKCAALDSRVTAGRTESVVVKAAEHEPTIDEVAGGVWQQACFWSGAASVRRGLPRQVVCDYVKA